MQVSILSGVTSDAVADFRTKYPRNRVVVPKANGISAGYLRPAPGIVSNGTAPGAGRGGVSWQGTLYRVCGSKLISVGTDGAVKVLGDVGGAETPVSFTYSFDRLAIASAGSLFYWNGSTLSKVTDTDLGTVVDVNWIAGYFMTTDGSDIIVTDLTNPASVNPLHYGSAESDPDSIYAVRSLREEAYAFGRFTIQVFENIGGDIFPFAPIKGATVPRGAVGTKAVTAFSGTFAFVGGGRTERGPEPPSVWLMTPGDAVRLSTREIDTILQGYSDSEMSACVLETRVDKGNNLLLVHMPDQTMVYDANTSAALQEPVWVTFDSGDLGSVERYRARDLVWFGGKWTCDDPTSTQLGYLVDDSSHHYGKKVGWDFGTQILYNEGSGAVIFNLELVGLFGRVALGQDPVVWTSYSFDGETWSQERAKSAGKRGDRTKRLAWRNQGQMQHWRLQRFRGTSDTHVTFARLEVGVEALTA